MTNKAFNKMKKEIDENATKLRAWHEGLAAGVEEMVKRIVAKDPNAKHVAMGAAIDIFDELVETNKELAEYMRAEYAKLEERVRAGEFAGAGKK